MLTMQFAVVTLVICLTVLETTGTSRSSSTPFSRELKDSPGKRRILSGEPSPVLAKRGPALQDRLNTRTRRLADSSFISAESNATVDNERSTGESQNLTRNGLLESEPETSPYKDDNRTKVTFPFKESTKAEEEKTLGTVNAPTLLTEAIEQPSGRNISEDTRSQVHNEKDMTEKEYLEDMTEKEHLEMTKSLNRPPWVVTKFHEKDRSENEARAHKSFPAPPRTELTVDDMENTRNTSTWSYQNYTHVTSIPDSESVSGNLSKPVGMGGSNTHKILQPSTRLVENFSTKSTSVYPETKDKRRRMYPDKVKYTMATKVPRKEKNTRDKSKVRTFTQSPIDHDDKANNVVPITPHAPATTPHAENNKTSSVENGELNEDCPTCGNQGLTEDEVKELRLNMFTDLLMQKLRMSPQDLADGGRSAEKQIPKLPEEVFEQTFKDKGWEDVSDDFYARDEEVIITGVDMGRDCIKTDSTGCYSFDLPTKAKNPGIASAHLWLYKARDRADVGGQTFIVYELGFARSGLLQERSQIARKELETMDDWININVTRYVTSWIEKRTAKQMLAIRCKTCLTRNYKALYGAKHGYKPILVIKYLKSNHDWRKKRSVSCDPRTECCKRPLIANFDAINMHNILQPKNVSVNFCYGYCDGIDQFTYNHTSIKQRMRWLHNVDTSMREQLKPCCVPLVLKDIFIMVNENGDLVRKILPKVIVEKCGCM